MAEKLANWENSALFVLAVVAFQTSRKLAIVEVAKLWKGTRNHRSNEHWISVLSKSRGSGRGLVLMPRGFF